MRRVWSQGMAWSTFPSVSLFQRQDTKVKFLMQQLSLASAGASCLAYFLPWYESAAASLQSVELLRCKSVTGICSLATPALPSFARSPPLPAQLPITRTGPSPEQPCLVLPSRQRGREEKTSPSPLTPECKQPCYGAFVKSWRLQSWWVRFSKGKAFKLVAAPWRGSSVTASKQEQIMSFILPTFRTREEITDLKGWSLNHKQYKKKKKKLEMVKYTDKT